MIFDHLQSRMNVSLPFAAITELLDTDQSLKRKGCQFTRVKNAYFIGHAVGFWMLPFDLK